MLSPVPVLAFLLTVLTLSAGPVQAQGEHLMPSSDKDALKWAVDLFRVSR
jgi:hypothetical protein